MIEPDEAVIVAEPLLTAVTTPPALTLATLCGLDDQVTGLLIVLPRASATTAERGSVAPNSSRLAELGVICTLAATCCTVTDTPDEVTPEADAVMEADPFACEVTVPVLETVATPELLLAQETATPLMVDPFWSLTVTESPRVSLNDDI